jgi:hypothetical protein
MAPGVRGWPTSLRAACCAAALLLAAAPARAQLVRGTITDGLSGRPVLGATVQVLNPDRSLRTSATTEKDGSFSMAPAPGLFVLRVERLGFATILSKPLEMSSTDTLNFEIHLPRAPIALESLDVVAKPFDPSGFYERQIWGWGKFIGPEEVKRMHATNVADLLTTTPGFVYVPAKGGPLTRMENRGRYCAPTVYVDGLLVAKGSSTPAAFQGGRGAREGVQLDELVPASQIHAVEIYQTGADAPLRFHAAGGGGGGGDCGVVVLWTFVGFGS